MSYAKVKDFFDQKGLSDRVVIRDHIGDTVEHAAKAIGCTPEKIAKTMTFLVEEKPIVIVMAGDAKIDNKKFKHTFLKRAKMIPSQNVEELIGHIPGAVCPFALKSDIPVYLDVSLKRFDVIYTAGGSLNSTVELSVEELETYSNSKKWIDIGKGWFI